MVSAFAWGCVVGFLVAAVIDVVRAIRSARRAARKMVADARARARGGSA